jgi:hypothetical protein
VPIRPKLLDYYCCRKAFAMMGIFRPLESMVEEKKKNYNNNNTWLCRRILPRVRKLGNRFGWYLRDLVAKFTSLSDPQSAYLLNVVMSVRTLCLHFSGGRWVQSTPPAENSDVVYLIPLTIHQDRGLDNAESQFLIQLIEI